MVSRNKEIKILNLLVLVSFIIFTSHRAHSSELNFLNNHQADTKKENIHDQKVSWTVQRRNLAKQALRTIRKYQLTTISIKCLIFQTDKNIKDGRYVIDILEDHSNDCPGDPAIEPRLFSVEIEQISGAIWTDGLSVNQQLEKIEDHPLPFVEVKK